MLEAFVIGFWKVLAWPAFGYMLMGIFIGFWVGLLPGIGGLSTLALMLPFSYTIKTPVEAFCFLLGMLAVTGTTGDLTSILFGIPGEGSSAALILDGYPMSKNGEAGRALGFQVLLIKRGPEFIVLQTLQSDEEFTIFHHVLVSCTSISSFIEI